MNEPKGTERGSPEGRRPSNILGLGSGQTELLGFLPNVFTPGLLFTLELTLFPLKIQTLINKLTLDLEVPAPNSPLGSAVAALGEMRRLVEEARSDWEAGEPRASKDKICEAADLANNDETFPDDHGGIPGLPSPPVSPEDRESLRSEINFMKLFIVFLIPDETNGENEEGQ